MNKTITMFAFLGAMTLPLLSGCGGGGSSSTPISPLVGTFRETSVSAGGRTATCPGSVLLADNTTDSCSANDTLQFRNDGTFTASFPQQSSITGTWQFANNILSLTFAGQTTSGSAVLSNNNNTLALTSPDGSSTNTDIYTRQ